MKIETVETFAIRAKPVDDNEYWGARAWKTAPKSIRHFSAGIAAKHARRSTAR